MRRLNLVYLCSEYPPFPHGGVGTVTQTLARSMVALGHRVTVVGLYRDVTGELCEDDQGVRVIRLGAARLPALNFVTNSRRLARRLMLLDAEAKIDIIEGQEAALAFLPATLPGKKVIRMHGGHHFFHTMLGQSPRLWRAWQEKRSFSKADALCAVSRFVAETTNQLLGQEGRNVEVIPNPVDTRLFCPRPNVNEETGLIVFAGTLCEKKGVRQLLQAMPLVLRQFPLARLKLYGRDTLVPSSRDSFKERLWSVLDAQTKGHVEFMGSVAHHELPGIFASASVCAFPSHMESQGLVILEAMAVGKAVVTSCLGPGPELVDSGIDGLLCDPKCPESIAAQIISLLSDDQRRSLIGRAAAKKVENGFPLQVLSAKNEGFYNNLVGMAGQ